MINEICCINIKQETELSLYSQSSDVICTGTPTEVTILIEDDLTSQELYDQMHTSPTEQPECVVVFQTDTPPRQSEINEDQYDDQYSQLQNIGV